MESNTKIPMAELQQKIEKLKTGTTTIGICIKDGVILATESQATAGYLVASKTAQKLFKINEKVGATIAGGVADCQYVVGQAQAISRLREIETGNAPSLEHIAMIVRNILFSGRSYYYSFMLVGGYSEKEKRGKVYAIDFIGFMAEETKFTSFGSGMYYAFGVLEANYKDDMTEKEGIELARKALKAARERDAGSGYGMQIVVITKDGFKAIEGPLTKTQ